MFFLYCTFVVVFMDGGLDWIGWDRHGRYEDCRTNSVIRYIRDGMSLTCRRRHGAVYPNCNAIRSFFTSNYPKFADAIVLGD